MSLSKTMTRFAACTVTAAMLLCGCGKVNEDAQTVTLLDPVEYQESTYTVVSKDVNVFYADTDAKISYRTETLCFAQSGYLAFVRNLRHIAEECGIHCNQSHAPFPVYCSEIRGYLKRAIECTAEAGGKICIVHPDNNKSAEENAEFYFELLPFAKDHGVKIAAENMWNWDAQKGRSSFAACATSESFLAHLEAVNDEHLVACLDIGHAEMKGSGDGAVPMICALGSHLKALHIHDNDLLHDDHQIPFSGKIDFDGVVSALRRIGYDGYFTLEADNYLNAYTEDNIYEGMVRLKESAARLALMYEQG